jgi:cytidylate kinase
MTPMVVAIDGPAGAGKSTVSRAVARALGYRHVDTGAMYRVVGVLAAERGVAPDDTSGLARLCDGLQIAFTERDGRTRVLADGRDLTDAIRTADAGQLASRVSAVPAVRERLVAMQRRLAAGGGVVMEGRDIGTVVCPEASVKIFLDASPAERARRRAAELSAGGAAVDLALMEREIAERDHRDRTRAHSPLRPAADAHVVDTTGRALEEVVAQVLSLARRRQDP